MKKTISVLLVIALILAGLFVLTGCDNGNGSKRKTTEISYSAPSIYSIKLNVPVEKNDSGEEVPKYKFVEEMPEAVKNILSSEGTYIVGDKIVVQIETSSYVYQTSTAYKEKYGDVTPSFEGFKEFIFAEGSTSTLKKGELTKLGDREAIKAETRYGAGSGDLYGYSYTVNIEDIYPRGYMTIRVVTADGNSESTAAVFADAEVQAIIDSIIITGVE